MSKRVRRMSNFEISPPTHPHRGTVTHARAPPTPAPAPLLRRPALGAAALALGPRSSGPRASLCRPALRQLGAADPRPSAAAPHSAPPLSPRARPGPRSSSPRAAEPRAPSFPVATVLPLPRRRPGSSPRRWIRIRGYRLAAAQGAPPVVRLPAVGGSVVHITPTLRSPPLKRNLWCLSHRGRPAA